MGSDPTVGPGVGREYEIIDLRLTSLAGEVWVTVDVTGFARLTMIGGKR